MNNNYFIAVMAIIVLVLYQDGGVFNPPAEFSDSLSVSTWKYNSLRIFYRKGEDVSIFYADARDSSVFRMDSYNIKSPKTQMRCRISDDSERTLIHKEILSPEDSTVVILAKILPRGSTQAFLMQRTANVLIKRQSAL